MMARTGAWARCGSARKDSDRRAPWKYLLFRIRKNGFWFLAQQNSYNDGKISGKFMEIDFF
jgi:hypothetical protein